MSPAFRTVYRLLLHFHPREFRVEFGDEMLWLFDEEMRFNEAKSRRLLGWTFLMLDAARSAFIQRVFRIQQARQASPSLFAYLDSAGWVVSIAQGGFFVISLLFSVFSIVLGFEMLLLSFRR